MEDFGYTSQEQENYTKKLIKKTLLLAFLLFSTLTFFYIAKNAYNYFQNNKEIKVIEAETNIIKTYPKADDKNNEIVKIDDSIYEDIFGNRKKPKKIKIKKKNKSPLPPKVKKQKRKQNTNPTKEIAKKRVIKKQVTRTINGRKMSRVQLAAMTSKDSAIRFLEITKSKYSSIFSSLDGYIQEVDLGKRGVFFRVQIGEFYDQVRAENFCKKYIAAAQKTRSDCIVID